MSVLFNLPKIGLTSHDALKVNAVLRFFSEYREIYDRLTLKIERGQERFVSGTIHEAVLRGDIRIAYQILDLAGRFTEGLRINAARQGALPAGIRKIFGLTVSDRFFKFVDDEVGFDLRERLFFRYSGECVDSTLINQTIFELSLQLDGDPLISLRVALPETSFSKLFGLLGGSVDELGQGATDLPLVDVAMRLCAIEMTLNNAAAVEPGDLVMIGRFKQGIQHIVINGSAFALRIEDGDARLDLES